MTAPPPPFSRRALLGLAAAGGACAVLPGRAAAEQMALADPVTAASPTITVAGPGDSEAAGWARLLQVPVGAGLAGRDGVQLRFVGGRDGVTGVNQFDARAMPDGADALLFPGSVFLAALAGDSRVRFEASHFLPLLMSVSPGVVMIRGGLAAKRQAPLRLAVQPGLDQAAAALLALDLLDVPATPAHAGPDILQAAQSGAADAVFVTGRDVPAQLAQLRLAGLAPAVTVASPGGAALQEAPDLLALLPPGRRQNDPLVAAWSGVAAASVTGMVLVLPRLAPAGAIASWRAACAAAASGQAVSDETGPHGIRMLSNDAADHAVTAMLTPAAGRAALRHWLGQRLDWQPS